MITIQKEIIMIKKTIVTTIIIIQEVMPIKRILLIMEKVTTIIKILEIDKTKHKMKVKDLIKGNITIKDRTEDKINEIKAIIEITRTEHMKGKEDAVETIMDNLHNNPKDNYQDNLKGKC